MPSCNTYHLTWVSLTLGVGYLFMAAPAKHSRCSLPWTRGISLAAVPDLQRGIALLGPPVPAQPLLLGLLLLATSPGLRGGWLLPAAAPGLGLRVAPQGHCLWPRVRGGFSRPPLTSDAGCLLLATTSLGRRVAPPAAALTSDAGCLLQATTDLGHGVAPLGHCP